jgi:gamma-glutamylcyclotransferase (GGCT)/AIG2-like uncharacterized protein YtfP
MGEETPAMNATLELAAEDTALGLRTGRPLPIFVYGTLRPGGGFYYRVEPLVTEAEPAILAGFDLHIASYPAIRQASSYTSRVRGDLLWITDIGAALRTCDSIESFHPPYATLYLRAVVTVRCGDNFAESTAAWAYLGGPGLRYTERNRVRSGDYFATLART